MNYNPIESFLKNETGAVLVAQQVELPLEMSRFPYWLASRPADPASNPEVFPMQTRDFGYMNKDGSEAEEKEQNSIQIHEAI